MFTCNNLRYPQKHIDGWKALDKSNNDMIQTNTFLGQIYVSLVTFQINSISFNLNEIEVLGEVLKSRK